MNLNKWPSIQYKFWVSLVLWKHNNRGTVLTWQWFRRWSLAPSTKRVRHRGSLLKGVAVQGVLYQSIFNAKLTGRKKLGKKMSTSNREASEFCQAKPIQTLGRDSQRVKWSWSQRIKSHHAQISSGKGLPSHFWNRNIVRSILPGLRKKRTRLLLSRPNLKSSFQIKVRFVFHLEIKVPESGGRVERHRIQAAWSPVWSFWSPWWFGVLYCLQVLVHCVLSSPKSVQLSTRRFWSTLCLHLLTSFIEMLISFSSRTLAPSHSA